MNLKIFEDADELTTTVAEWITNTIRDTLEHSPRFTIALSGGNTPKQLFSKLGSSPYAERVDWNKLHIFWGDERFVPLSDERNNANMAFHELLSKVPIPSNQIHRIRTDIPADESVEEYEKLLRDYFDRQPNSFDLVLLGMGEDGHTLSLFPENPIAPKVKLVIAVYKADQDMWRITLTPTIINAAANVAFLVSGTSKAAILKQVINSDMYYPAKLIQPENGDLYWFLDADAASEL